MVLMFHRKKIALAPPLPLAFWPNQWTATCGAKYLAIQSV